MIDWVLVGSTVFLGWFVGWLWVNGGCGVVCGWGSGTAVLGRERGINELYIIKLHQDDVNVSNS